MNLQTLTTGWDFTRWLRLVLAVAITFQAIEAKDMFLGGLAILLFYQAIANVGCCGVNNCSAPPAKNNNTQIQEIEFEEIKTK